MTTFIVYAPIPPGDVVDRLGRPEYSYAFVLSRFRPLLDSLGTVRPVTDPQAEVDAVYDECARRGDPCVFLCFAPPHRAPIGLRCPSSTVFAWEFETIPDHAWGGEPRNDWRIVLADHGRAIVLSQHTAAAVRATMGPDFPVAAIPAPVYDRFTQPPARAEPPTGPRAVAVEGTLIDSRQFEFTSDGLRSDALAEQLVTGPWDGRTIELDFSGQDAARLTGFYSAEPWGSWTRVADPALALPVFVQGPVEIVLVAHGLGVNADREIEAELGTQRVRFRLPRRRSHIRLRFDVTDPDALLTFRGIAAVPPPGLDERTMGMGLARLLIRRPSSIPIRAERLVQRLRRKPATEVIPQHRQTLELEGLVYTSVLNPADHRKNWQQLISAFCWAFRDDPDATLLLKMTHHSLASYTADLQYILHQVGTTRCRVVALHGFLPDDQYERLMAATTYYANASSAEGLCMPLMEFLSAGIPAVATDNTAMADYLTLDCSFEVRSTPGFTHWPHDDRRLIRALEHRVNWDSLVDAFRDSAAVARDRPDRYRAMSAAAQSAMADFCSDTVVADRLRLFLWQDVPA